MNIPWLLIVLGLAIDPIGSKAQLDDGGLYDNYTDYEACKAYLGGDQRIQDERWDIDFANCIELKIEKG